MALAIEQHLRTKLLAYAPLAALVGVRVRPLVAEPTDVMPYLLFRLSDETEWAPNSGISDVFASSFDLAVFSQSYSECKNVSGQVRHALAGWKNAVDSGSKTTVQDWNYRGRQDEYIPDDADERGIYVETLSVEVYWRDDETYA